MTTRIFSARGGIPLRVSMSAHGDLVIRQGSGDNMEIIWIASDQWPKVMEQAESLRRNMQSIEEEE